MRLDKKNIIVTAAAQGIGRATALKFANEGAKVLATDINEDKLNDLKNENKSIQTMKLDSTNKKDVETFCSSIDKIDVLFQDYRFIKGEFDRVVSIEMIEAVGHKYLPVYFNKINTLLNKTGKALIQAITIRDDVYNDYKSNSDWIRKYIFPGGHLPSVGHIKSLLDNTNLNLSKADNIGLHYVKTLEDWKKAFFAKLDEIKKKGFDEEFIRKWHYYFEYSQAGFMQEYIQDFHLVFDKK